MYRQIGNIFNPQGKGDKAMTNAQFAKENTTFIAACRKVILRPAQAQSEAIYLTPTRAQARKWRLKKGLAYKTAKGLLTPPTAARNI